MKRRIILFLGGVALVAGIVVAMWPPIRSGCPAGLVLKRGMGVVGPVNYCDIPGRATETNEITKPYIYPVVAFRLAAVVVGLGAAGLAWRIAGGTTRGPQAWPQNPSR